MLLRNKLLVVRLCKANRLGSYLARVKELRDQLVSIWASVEDKELVSITLNGFSLSWKSFVQGVYARENLSVFVKLCYKLVYEEIRLESCSQRQKEAE